MKTFKLFYVSQLLDDPDVVVADYFIPMSGGIGFQFYRNQIKTFLWWKWMSVECVCIARFAHSVEIMEKSK